MLLGGGNSNGDRPARGARSEAQIATDAAITAAVREEFVTDSVLSQYDLSVQTFDHRVTLRGSVGSHGALERAVRLAGEVDGVDSVDNRVRVDEGG